MSRFFIITVVSLATFLATFSTDAEALTRRQRLHSKWVIGVSTSYLTAQNYSQCWENAQVGIVPSQATKNIRFQNCLSSNQYYYRHNKWVKMRIRNSCNTLASQLIAPTEFQQQTRYKRCLRKTRHSMIRSYLTNVTCGNLYGRSYSRCVSKLNLTINGYGYQRASHILYLDNLYRNRYNKFSRRFPDHRFVKKYKSHHRTKRIIRKIKRSSNRRFRNKNHNRTKVNKFNNRPYATKKHDRFNTYKRVRTRNNNRRIVNRRTTLNKNFSNKVRKTNRKNKINRKRISKRTSKRTSKRRSVNRSRSRRSR